MKLRHRVGLMFVLIGISMSHRPEATVLLPTIIASIGTFLFTI